MSTEEASNCTLISEEASNCALISEEASNRKIMAAEEISNRTLWSSFWRVRRLRIWSGAVLLIVAALVVQIIVPEWKITRSVAADLAPLAILAIFLTAMLCEYIDSTLGMGYGTTLTPILLLAGFEPLQIVPAVLLSECLTGLAAGLLHHRDGNVDFLRDRGARRTAVLLTVLSVVGSVIAVNLALRISKFWLTAIIAVIVLSIGVLILATVRRQLRYRPVHIVILGGIAAFNKALSGGGYGPLVTGGQVVSGINSKSAVAITSRYNRISLMAVGKKVAYSRSF